MPKWTSSKLFRNGGGKEVDIRYDVTNRKQKREMKSMFNQKTLPMIVVPSQGYARNLLKRNAKQTDLRFHAE